ncbi:MAG: hypothetical protein ACM3X0_00965 [Bacteroidota bacterium]
MFRPANCRAWLLVGLLAASGLARAETVACHVDYGGESRVIEAEPVSSPYAIAPRAIGSYFLFRIVFRDAPADLAGIKLYTYADHASGPALIHQASYHYPASNAAVGGFTGQQRVYEPLRDGELQYWCELTSAARS